MGSTYSILSADTPAGVEPGRRIRVRVRLQRLKWWQTVLLVLAAGVVAGMVLEARTSWLQSRLLAPLARKATYRVETGPSAGARWTGAGPYDERLGYAHVPEWTGRLARQGFKVTAQARPSEWMQKLAGYGLYPTYKEKTTAGLEIVDRAGEPLYAVHYPGRGYETFEAIPPLVVDTLMFVENREILDASTPYRNPAVEWSRLIKAVMDQGWRKVDSHHSSSGGSTLATQLEKIRHSPDGRTLTVADKLRQMASASLRAYQGGERTVDARKQILCDYLNSLPLASQAGYGEVLGLGDGLWAWFEADWDRVNRLLTAGEDSLDAVSRQERALAYRQALCLLLAVNRPSSYLIKDRDALQTRADAYLRMLADSRLISPDLRDRAIRLRPAFREEPPQPPVILFADRKAVDGIRSSLLPSLGLDSTYRLDRLDLRVHASVDRAATVSATRMLKQLTDDSYAAAAGVVGYQMLKREAVESVIYSFTLFEAGVGRNLLRVQADNYDQPLNINQGTRLELGSTAKLRTLATYLEVIAELHQRYSGKSARELRRSAAAPEDRLSVWALDYLATTDDPSLPAMLEAAMARTYSASPEETFFTGGGLHHFANFDSKDNVRVMTLREAFQRSVNLVFIRLMRDVSHYFYWRREGASPRMFDDVNHPLRADYLARFADREGRDYLARFHHRYQGLGPDEMLEKLAAKVRPTPVRLAVVFRTARPNGTLAQFQAFLSSHLRYRGAVPYPELYRKYGPEKFGWGDRGYMARVHPLELWLVSYLAAHPRATLEELDESSAGERQDTYRWLRSKRHKQAQDLRIRIMMEVDAFAEIHKIWRRHGYPFPSLVPSYATAIGCSGDNPAALTELAGVILNGGMRYPAMKVERLHFARATPAETVLEGRATTGERVMTSQVASVLKHEMSGVVELGTARRAFGSLVLSDGRKLDIGGKTGTGDNRLETVNATGQVTQSRVMSRTAAFVFVIGDRYFGAIIGYVPGEQAGAQRFTSALPVQIFRHLAPVIRAVIERPDSPGSADHRIASASAAIPAAP